MKSGRETDQPRSPRGVIGSLAAGFEVLGQNLLLVALPVVLDLVLWLGPRVSVAPLVENVKQVLTAQQTVDPEVTGQIEQAMSLLERFGEQYNLLSVLGGVPMFQVPSLLARRAPAAQSPLGSPRVVSLSSMLTLIPWWGTLALAGLVLGFLYLNEIAHQIGEADFSHAEDVGGTGGDNSLQAGLWKFFRFLSFAFGLMATGSILFPLWILIVALGTTIAQPLGILFWVGGVGMLSYAALHLLFVIPGLLLGGRRLVRAIGESVVLSHVSLSSVLGFVLLVLVIYEGFGYAWSLPHSDSWALLVGILGNAFVATGLTGAAFVFYRDHMMVGPRLMATEE